MRCALSHPRESASDLRTGLSGLGAPGGVLVGRAPGVPALRLGASDRSAQDVRSTGTAPKLGILIGSVGLCSMTFRPFVEVDGLSVV
jgi:hypothetical protein